VPERGQPGDSLVAHGLAAAAQALDDGVEVTGIPQHDGVEDQAEGGELNFLAFAIGLPDLAAVAVADLAAEAVAGFGVSVRLLSPGTRDCVVPGQERPLRAG
jgi:hypothetical protein